jgi:hypothetical protein
MSLSLPSREGGVHAGDTSRRRLESRSHRCSSRHERAGCTAVNTTAHAVPCRSYQSSRCSKKKARVAVDRSHQRATRRAQQLEQMSNLSLQSQVNIVVHVVVVPARGPAGAHTHDQQVEALQLAITVHGYLLEGQPVHTHDQQAQALQLEITVREYPPSCSDLLAILFYESLKYTEARKCTARTAHGT